MPRICVAEIGNIVSSRRLKERRQRTHVSRNNPKPSNLSIEYTRIIDIVSILLERKFQPWIRKHDEPTLPNTGPGSARPFVTQSARPSPNKCDDSPEILNSTSMTKLAAVTGNRDQSHPYINEIENGELNHMYPCTLWNGPFDLVLRE